MLNKDGSPAFSYLEENLGDHANPEDAAVMNNLPGLVKSQVKQPNRLLAVRREGNGISDAICLSLSAS